MEVGNSKNIPQKLRIRKNCCATGVQFLRESFFLNILEISRFPQIIQSTEEARNFLKSGKTIGSSAPCTNIRVAPDLTPRQRRCRSGTLNADSSNRITVDDIPCVIPSSEIPDHGMQQTFPQALANVSQALYNDIDADTEMVDMD
ncbi:unnamed protein product [Trichobilharzia regenti]|nr:unnamed protein product [Trichobilharzia regenti]